MPAGHAARAGIVGAPSLRPLISLYLPDEPEMPLIAPLLVKVLAISAGQMRSKSLHGFMRSMVISNRSYAFTSSDYVEMNMEETS